MAEEPVESDREPIDLDAEDIRRADGTRVTREDLRRLAEQARRDVSTMWPFNPNRRSG